jgi:PhnB protein
MAKRSRFEQLDDAVEAIMTDALLPVVDPAVEALLRIAAELRGLPSPDFKQRLKSDLQRSTAPSSHRIVPYLQVNGAARLIDFLKDAFDAEELCRIPHPGGIAHAEVRIGAALLQLADATAEFPPAPSAIHVYVPDVDAVHARALRAGAHSILPPADQDYGDRDASIKDPFGNHWYIATHRQQGDAPARPDAHVPEGVPNVMPYFHPRGAPQLIDFLRRAFDAEETFRYATPDGGVVHAKVRIGDSVLELSEAQGLFQPMRPALHLYVADADAVYRQALGAGAQSLFEPADRDYGERLGGVKDPFDNVWYIATPQPSGVGDRVSGVAEHRLSATPDPRPPTPDRGGPMAVNPVPLSSAVPYLCCKDAARAIEFYKRAFGAIETMRLSEPGSGKIGHAEIKIGEALVMLADEYPDHGVLSPATIGGSPVGVSVYVRDVDALVRQAAAAGATVERQPENQFYGDRTAKLRDPFGHTWHFQTHIEDVSAEEMQRRYDALYK